MQEPIDQIIDETAAMLVQQRQPRRMRERIREQIENPSRSTAWPPLMWVGTGTAAVACAALLVLSLPEPSPMMNGHSVMADREARPPTQSGQPDGPAPLAGATTVRRSAASRVADASEPPPIVIAPLAVPEADTFAIDIDTIDVEPLTLVAVELSPVPQ